ncbi:MAG: acyl-ACP--UDP-N-acetylglucosamine O-acyltransferase [Bdellovibrionota bacterium]
MSGVKIHPTAIVEDGAELGAGVEIGAFCRVSAQAKIGARTRLISHVVLDGIIALGEDNVVHPFAVLGGAPQDLSYKNEATTVMIGDRNIFRESVTVSRGTARDKTTTRIGNDNFIMAYCHVAHDCIVGNNVIMANQVALAGHVEVGDYVVIGGLSAVVQKCRLGSYSFLGGSTIMRRDLPPFMAAKEFSSVSGPNAVGLRRRNLGADSLRVINDLYKIFYLGNLSLEKALSDVEEKYPENSHAKLFLEFVRSSKAGVQR